MKILIAYGTRFGSTAEVSEELATLFEKAGHKVLLLNLKETPEEQWPSPKDFDGILVGSSIKTRQWMKEPKAFLKKNGEYMNKEILLGVFVCSAYAADREKRPRIREEYISTVLNELGMQADIYDAFGGVIDFSESSKMGWLDKTIMKIVSRKQASGNDPAIKKNARNDLRDWNQIRAFGEKFAGLLKNRT
jgi:menaquinone-dependent protoporphyrinogen oxidase